ncbi:uncharacterized protein CELE_B0416.7 [Caenorhabditis elegans]|uniref:Uncharacterized protein n=1 Tax=Caenorhabditis elegans TaxID=6239 RepID=Q2L6Y1_CAEEL|nr:Uncharacterized protein CELE_B0416.7 [Caenorhabditis elegans]CCD61927.1 Uncharacterized protein CELE_B0416.7 [Caenorhabditis elegans]|eukprot:NP_001041211.1 Uncharacterized protein CELE_B0416.7 [Caenorhabditis elegans]
MKLLKLTILEECKKMMDFWTVILNSKWLYSITAVATLKLSSKRESGEFRFRRLQLYTLLFANI